MGLGRGGPEGVNGGTEGIKKDAEGVDGELEGVEEDMGWSRGGLRGSMSDLRAHGDYMI